MCDAAVHRVDDAVGRVADRLGPDGANSGADSDARIEAS
jgi:hypothetical protein